MYTQKDQFRERFDSENIKAASNCRLLFPDWANQVPGNPNPCKLEKIEGNTIAVVGDSHAGQLFIGLREASKQTNGIAIFDSSCAAPYLNISSGAKNKPPEVTNNLKNNYKLINKAYEYILENQDIKIVLLAHAPSCSFNNAVDMKDLTNNDYISVLKNGMRISLDSLILANKKAYIVFDNPELDYDPKLCLPRPFRIIEKNNKCSFPRANYDQKPFNINYRNLTLDVLKAYPQVQVIDLTIPLCDSENCYISKNGKLIYRDPSHLNEEGSKYVANYILDRIGLNK